ncbi:hypothetical protein UK12_21355 [Saccharothrix sp. ST-888]|nr:hypothetical protein UK12_21355 [Saccharothrix sp. ST-888]
MRVAKGATGFWTSGRRPLPETDLSAFRSACFAAARRVHGQVADETGPAAASFRSVGITEDGRVRGVLCHVRLPYVAFVSGSLRPGEPLPSFGDPPGWANRFTAVGLRVLGTTELLTPLGELDLSELAPAELTQVRYWRPESLGELLFNRWD